MSRTTDTVRLALVMMSEQAGEMIAGSAMSWTKAEVESAVLDAEVLQRNERTLQRINENQCNGYPLRNGSGWDADAAKRDEAKAEKIQAASQKLADRYALALRFGGDPRGSAIKIATPQTGQFNGMGGREDGWAVC